MVELLSENGRPVNKEGEAVAKESDFNGGTETGKYIVLDDTTGNPVLLDPGTDRERFRYSTSQPATCLLYTSQITKLILDVHLLQMNIKEMIYINLQMITTK